MILALLLMALVAALLVVPLNRRGELWLNRWRNRLHRAPCCPSCSGRGAGGTAMVESHGGLCWDCQATGHPHAPDWWNRIA